MNPPSWFMIRVATVYHDSGRKGIAKLQKAAPLRSYPVIRK